MKLFGARVEVLGIKVEASATLPTGENKENQETQSLGQGIRSLASSARSGLHNVASKVADKTDATVDSDDDTVEHGYEAE